MRLARRASGKNSLKCHGNGVGICCWNPEELLFLLYTILVLPRVCHCLIFSGIISINKVGHRAISYVAYLLSIRISVYYRPLAGASMRTM